MSNDRQWIDDAPAAPQRVKLRVGFMPLADCAPLVMASVLELDVKHGVEFVLSREHSWAGVRDKLLSGALDLAHALYGMVYGVQLGIGGLQRDMAVLMGLNRNGQGIGLSRRLADAGAVDGPSLAALLQRQDRRLVLAQTFPTGTHAMWLYYWLAAAGIHPLRDVTTLVVPPSQMVAALRAGQIDGFSVGAPWLQLGTTEGVAVHATASHDIWPDHPEKVLACTADFADRQPDAARAAMAAILEASRWIDANDSNRHAAAALIAGDDYVATRTSALTDALLGRCDDGHGRRWQDPQRMDFHAGGAVNFPYLSDGMWFMTQHQRWGLLAEHPDYAAVAARVQRVALYREAASAVRVPVPTEALRSSRLIDGQVWDGQDPRRYADGFALRADPAAALPH